MASFIDGARMTVQTVVSASEKNSIKIIMKFMKGAYAKYIEQDPFTVGRCARNTMTYCNGLDTEGR